jgi:hypothetical protein
MAQKMPELLIIPDAARREKVVVLLFDGNGEPAGERFVADFASREEAEAFVRGGKNLLAEVIGHIQDPWPFSNGRFDD